jgi:hypothetical protein
VPLPHETQLIDYERRKTVTWDPPEPFDSPPFDPREAIVRVGALGLWRHIPCSWTQMSSRLRR